MVWLLLVACSPVPLEWRSAYRGLHHGFVLSEDGAYVGVGRGEYVDAFETAAGSDSYGGGMPYVVTSAGWLDGVEFAVAVARPGPGYNTVSLDGTWDGTWFSGATSFLWAGIAGERLAVVVEGVAPTVAWTDPWAPDVAASVPLACAGTAATLRDAAVERDRPVLWVTTNLGLLRATPEGGVVCVGDDGADLLDLDGDRLYLAHARDTELRARDLEGDLVWRKRLDDPIVGLASDGERIAVLTQPGRVHLVLLDTAGTVLGERSLPRPYTGVDLASGVLAVWTDDRADFLDLP